MWSRRDRPLLARLLVPYKFGLAFRHPEPVHSSYRTTLEALGLEMVSGDSVLEQPLEHFVAPG